MYADIIIPIALNNIFTYEIPDFMENNLVGKRVIVPFGKSNFYTGIVQKVHDKKPTIYTAKPLHSILDDSPIITQNQLKLWHWISSYYMCSVGEVMRISMPTAFRLENKTVVQIIDNEIDTNILNEKEIEIMHLLKSTKKIELHKIIKKINDKNIFKTIKSLQQKNIISLEKTLKQKYKPKTENIIYLKEKYLKSENLKNVFEILKNAPKQKEIILFLISQKKIKKQVKLTQLLKKLNTNHTTINSLIKKGFLEKTEVYQDRINYFDSDYKTEKNLSDIQKKALNEIKNNFKKHNITLLHGVTSSGKTEIYTQLIEENIKAQKQSLLLVPEIALTNQIQSRLKSIFGEKLVVYHSKYNDNERVEIWNKILNEKPLVILGARSSLFLPFNDLGIIIVDEEHDNSYKQISPNPRYNARDSAIVLGQISNSKVLLGSATPSLESYFNAQNNKYGLVKLLKRHKNIALPKIEIIDLKEKYHKKRMTGHFCDSLILEIQKTLDNGKQIILFQNRRGFSNSVICQDCGHSPKCPNCDVALTFHSFSSSSKCHYCGYSTKKHIKCQSCGSNKIDTKGLGTQQIQTEATQLFENAIIDRMDFDTTKGKNSHNKIIQKFESGKTNILIGTQMVSKGLDFENVKLVAILNADNMLWMPNFRAQEKAFQLMSQVAGRSGRSGEQGKVLIQTFNPHHKIIQQVSSNDFDKMFEEQLHERRGFQYPPFNKIITISVKDISREKTKQASIFMAKMLKQGFEKNIFGPEPPQIEKIRNRYIQNIMIKIPQKNSLKNSKKFIEKCKNQFLFVKEFRSVRLIIDVDSL